jgi:AraC-like DNA-binding protein
MSKMRHIASAAITTLSYEYPSGHLIPAHTHDRHQVVYASQGVMTVQTPGGSWVVPPHRGVWIPAHVVHSIQISGVVSMRTLYISPRIAHSLSGSCQVLNISPLLRELILHAVSLGRLDEGTLREARLIAVILDQLEVIPSSGLQLLEPRDPRAARVARHLRDHPDERRPLAKLLRGVGASARTIERLFRADTGMSFGRWRQQLRLVHALRLLAMNRSITTVALDVGYESPSAFVYAFRRTFGVTPGRYFGPSRSAVGDG